MLRKQLRQTFRCSRHCVAVASAVAFTAAAAAVTDVAVSATILCWSACQRCPLSLSLAAVRAALLHALCVCVCLPMGNRNARAAAASASASALVAVFVALLHELYVFSGP